jgi:hypothetical protein
MLRISQLAALALAAATAAAAPCPEQDRGTLQEWTCFGELEYASQSAGQPDLAARFVFFPNRERLYEKREPDGTRMMLRGDDYALFRGLGREDSTVIGIHHPFLFFEFAVWTALIPLAASEFAPAALPAGVTQVHYAGIGKAAALMRDLGIRRVDGTIERNGTEYLFKALSTGVPLGDLPTISVTGRWSSADIEPYPDSMSLSGWQYGCTRPRGTDVRNNHRPVPPGVTLGDIRRGWNGPCD